jgi:hypothetical protein
MEDNVTTSKHRAIDQGVVRPLTKEARVLLQALQSIWDLWWTNAVLGQVFLLILRLSPVSINTPYTFIHLPLTQFILIH